MEKVANSSLDQLAKDYILRLASHSQTGALQELRRFVRWCGKDKDVNSLSPNDIANYAQWAAPSGGEALKRLEPVKVFLAHLKKRGYIKENLGVHLRVVKGNVKNHSSQVKAAVTEAVHLTQEGYLKLQEELESLKGERTSIVQQVQAARADKDFRENAPLDAAREAQARLEARVRELEAVLKSGVIIDNLGKRTSESSKIAHLGTKVTLREIVTGDLASYLLVGTNEANLAAGKLSATSPTGKVILDKPEGAEIEVSAPMGSIRYRIEKIEN